MYKKISFLLCCMAIGFSACNKTTLSEGCAANQICTTEFRSISIQFVNKNGAYAQVKDITVVNQRTNQPVIAKGVLDPGFSPNDHFIVTDSNKSEFSTRGDNVKITATSIADNKTVTAIYKISGGCNCHVQKLSGPDKVLIE